MEAFLAALLAEALDTEEVECGAAARGVDMRIGLDALLLFATFCAKRKHEKVRFYALLKQGIVWQVAGTTYKTESLHSMM
jgi:hypothetical protein